MLVLFLGRSIDGILADARKEFPDEGEILILARKNDQLEPPAGMVAVPADEFQPTAHTTYVVVANGGTTSQLLPTVKKLVEANVKFSAWDLQREEKVQVW